MSISAYGQKFSAYGQKFSAYSQKYSIKTLDKKINDDMDTMWNSINMFSHINKYFILQDKNKYSNFAKKIKNNKYLKKQICH